MAINIDEDNLKHGLLGLVVAIVEVIRDTLRLQAMKRIESGRLTDAEVERLGSALDDLDKTIDELKEEQGITEAVQNVRDGLDGIANDAVNKLINPRAWLKEGERIGQGKQE